MTSRIDHHRLLDSTSRYPAPCAGGIVHRLLLHGPKRRTLPKIRQIRHARARAVASLSIIIPPDLPAFPTALIF